MAERWKGVVGVDHYEVSNLGRVRSFCYRKRKANRVTAGKPIIIKQSMDGKGYPTVNLFMGGRCVPRRLVHRLVLIAFRGPPGDGLLCNHIDGNPSNNRLSNLEWVTNAENSQKGRKAILCAQDVRRIRSSKEKQKVIAKKYGISLSAVNDVICRRRWANVA